MPSDYYTSYISFITATPKDDFIPVGNTNGQKVGGRKLLPTSRIVLYTAETMKNKVALCLTGLLCVSISSFFLMALKNIRILCLGFLCFMLFNLSDAWAQSAESRTAEGQTEIKPLRLGEKVPEEFWTREHLYFVNGDTVRKTLKEHRGKTLVLDFWFSGCTKCMVHQKEINYYKERYPQELAVVMVNSRQTNEGYEKIKTFMNTARFKRLAIKELVSIIEDDYLEMILPHIGYPTYVWINSSEVIQLTTFRNLLDRNYYAPFVEGRR